MYFVNNDEALSLNWKEAIHLIDKLFSYYYLLLLSFWFDLLNSQNMVEEKNLLDRMDNFVLSMRVHGKKLLIKFRR